MPATAGRVRMPANNRVHSSAALQTHGIWQSAIGYDPYAPNKDDSKNPSNQMAATAEPEGENPYASFQGLLALARITGSNADEARGACKKCGRVGHLTFQCKNLVSLKESKEKHSEFIQAAVLNGMDKLKGGKLNGKDMESVDDDEEEDDESESSDSDVDSEIERIIAERSGKKVSSKAKKSKKKKAKSDDDDESNSDYGERHTRGRKKRSGKKRGSSDSDDENERTRKRRKRDESSGKNDEHRRHRKRKSRKEKRRRRSHRSPDDSESSDVSDDSSKWRRRKSKRDKSLSDSDASGLDDSRVGRGMKRFEKRSRKRHHEHDE